MNIFYNLMFFLQAILLAYSVKVFHGVYFKNSQKQPYHLRYYVPLVIQSFTALYFDMNPYFNFISAITCLFISTLYIKTSFKHRSISSLFLLVFICTTELLVTHTILTALGIRVTSETTIPTSLISVLLIFSCRILMLSVIYCYKKFSKNMKSGQRFDYFYLLTPILAHFMLLLLSFIISPLLEQDKDTFVVWLICFTFGFLIINFLSFITNLDLEEYRTRAIILDQEIEHYAKEHQLLGKYLKEVSVLKHNIKHELLPILAKLPKENNEILAEFESVFDKVLTDDYKVFSKISWLDMILNYHLNKAENTHFSIKIDPNLVINTDPKMICIILGNLLDNTFDAHATNVSIKMVHLNSNLFIKIENPFSSELTLSNGLPLSTKNEPNLHGFGLASVKKIVQDNDGIFKLSHQNNFFTVEILLPN